MECEICEMEFCECEDIFSDEDEDEELKTNDAV